MNIIRYNTPSLTPWSSIDRVSSLRDLFSAFPLAGFGAETSSRWAPSLDVLQDGDAVTVKLELAGMKKEDFDIALEEGVLTISGNRSAESESNEGTGLRRERVFGSFRRTVTLPAPVKADAVTASYTDGVLTVTLPKAEEAKPKKIEISLN